MGWSICSRTISLLIRDVVSRQGASSIKDCAMVTQSLMSTSAALWGFLEVESVVVSSICTEGDSRCRKREQRRSRRCRQSAPCLGSSKPLTRQEFSLSLRPSTPSTMSSFSNGSPINSRREIAHDPTASTHDCGSPTQWQGRTDSGSLCPGSPSAGSVLPHITRPHLCTGAAALLPAPQKRRWPCPSVHASLLQWHSLLLSTRPPARLAYPRAHARAKRPPSPRRPQCGGGQAAPHVCHTRAQPGLLHHRLQRGTPAPCSPLPAGL